MPSLKDIYTSSSSDAVTNLLTTKGDILVQGTILTKLPVGNSNTILSADSTTDSGLRWIPNESGYSVVNASFTAPTVGAEINIQVSNTTWMLVGMYLYIQDGGTYQLISILSSSSIRIKNLYPENVTGTIGIAKKIVATARNGTNAFTLTTLVYTQPAVNSTVTVTVDNPHWIVVNQNIFIESGGHYLVTSKNGNSLTIQNLGYETNASPNSSISISKLVSPSGIRGSEGIVPYSTSNASFTMPVVNDTVNLACNETRWIALNNYVFIETAGIFQVTAKTTNSITIKNVGSATNALSGVTISTNKLIAPTGPVGEKGTNALLTYTLDAFSQPVSNNTVNVNVVTTEFLAVGSYVFIEGAGFYLVDNINSLTQIRLLNINTSGNANPGSTIATNKLVVPASRPGIDGTNGTNGTDGTDGVGMTYLGIFTTPPSSPNLNDVYRNSTTAILFIYDGTGWVELLRDGISGADGTDGATGSVNSASSLSLDHQLTSPSGIADKLVLYSQSDGLYYRQPDNNISLVLIDTDLGTEIGDLIELVDVNGLAGLPAVDGSQLLNLPNSGHTIQNEDIGLTQQTKLNFKGDLVNANDNAVNESTDVVISSGLNTLGDLLFHNGTIITRLPKGTDGYILASDDTNGLDWIPAPTGGGGGVTSYNDLTDQPTLGTAAAKDVGLLEGNVVEVQADGKLPALDGSLLTNLSSGGGTNYTFQDEGINLTDRSIINFTGNLVQASDDAGNSKTNVSINLPTVINMGSWTP